MSSIYSNILTSQYVLIFPKMVPIFMKCSWFPKLSWLCLHFSKMSLLSQTVGTGLYFPEWSLFLNALTLSSHSTNVLNEMWIFGNGTKAFPSFLSSDLNFCHSFLPSFFLRLRNLPKLRRHWTLFFFTVSHFPLVPFTVTLASRSSSSSSATCWTKPEKGIWGDGKLKGHGFHTH